MNRIQLALYYAIGKYLSQHTRKGVWGEGALAAISEQLRKDLPGLRGFSETQMKDMRRFYEAWKMLDNNMTVATAELQDKEYQIDIFHTLTITNIPEFPVDDFFKVPFTHHSAIIIGTKDTSARYYYIHRTAEEHLAVKKLRQLIKEDAFHSQGHIPNNFLLGYVFELTNSEKEYVVKNIDHLETLKFSHATVKGFLPMPSDMGCI